MCVCVCVCVCLCVSVYVCVRWMPVNQNQDGGLASRYKDDGSTEMVRRVRGM